ncbi:hypothetical protein L484_018726 [Morus notabilis]|uniref:Uncharacterized protein n=1 Tax=Morus notabilis TaxID=981085 RepID=W9RPE8_9ROSA|nr:hypothetical protein L484_018726 [Morus notabilis]
MDLAAETNASADLAAATKAAADLATAYPAHQTINIILHVLEGEVGDDVQRQDCRRRRGDL